MSPIEFRPQTADDFVGPARQGARLVDRLVTSRRSAGTPIKVLFKGPAGTGKSALADYLRRTLGCNGWSVRKLNGTQVKIETVEDLSRDLAFRNLGGGYTFIWVDEADKIPQIAQVRFLTLMDDLPPFVAVVCTSNCQLDEFEERFQTRFQVMEITGPTRDELKPLLNRFSGEDVVQKILACACGEGGEERANVRQALLDLDLALLSA